MDTRKVGEGTGEHDTFQDSQEQAWAVGKQWQVGVEGWTERAGKFEGGAGIWSWRGIWTRERGRHPKKVSVTGKH